MRWLGQQRRRARCRNLSRVCRRRNAVRRKWRGAEESPPATWAWASDGKPTENFQAGVELHRQVHAVCRGCARPSGAPADPRFKLNDGRDPQTWGIGIKEIWEVDLRSSRPGWCCTARAGRSTHRTYGGRLDVSLRRKQSGAGGARRRPGLLRNPYLSPFDEFQRYKTHPAIRAYPRRRQAVDYGPRAINGERIAVLPKTRLPGRRADRLRCRLSERPAHQGFACRHQERHTGRGGGVRCARRRSRAGRTRRLSAQRSNQPGCTTNCIARAISSHGWTRGCMPAR